MSGDAGSAWLATTAKSRSRRNSCGQVMRSNRGNVPTKRTSLVYGQLTLTVSPPWQLLCMPTELMCRSVSSSRRRIALSPDHGNPAAKSHHFAEGCFLMPVRLVTYSVTGP